MKIPLVPRWKAAFVPFFSGEEGFASSYCSVSCICVKKNLNTLVRLQSFTKECWVCLDLNLSGLCTELSATELGRADCTSVIVHQSTDTLCPAPHPSNVSNCTTAGTSWREIKFFFSFFDVEPFFNILKRSRRHKACIHSPNVSHFCARHTSGWTSGLVDADVSLSISSNL